MSRPLGQIIELGARIQLLKDEIAERKREKADLERQLRRLIDQEAGAPEVGVDRESLAFRVLELLQENAEQTFEAEHVRVGLNLPENSIGSIRATLARLSKGPDVAKVGRGRYRAEVPTGGVKTSTPLRDEPSAQAAGASDEPAPAWSPDDDIPF